jgi:excisionase family DNA binding protein
VSARTAARIAGVSESSVYRWVREGRLTGYAVEGVGTPRYHVAEVQAVAAGELARLGLAA